MTKRRRIDLLEEWLAWRAWEQASPVQGYPRGKLSRENEWRHLQGLRAIPYPESAYVGGKRRRERKAKALKARSAFLKAWLAR